ncbi:MAG: hypothetical protein JWM99_4289 [Verrucomicrobiales bacterium]|nr:hypothetical protein [Verrucomicrobiales bacterium]
MNKRKIRFITTTAALGFIFCGLLSGCSTFQREWRQSAKGPPPAEDISGRWLGTWKSDSSGHNDKLRCVITKADDQHYTARFHAKYKHILSFGYTVPLVVTNEGGKRTFKGEADLGKLAGGRYTYEGSATPTEFNSRYDSKYDRGAFEMKRP